MNPSARAVLFDLDNTLHDRDAGVLAFLRIQHAELGLAERGISPEKWIVRFVELEERGRVWKDVVYARLVEEFALPYRAASLLEDYERGFARSVVPNEGLHETIVLLRAQGCRLGVVTNGRSAFQRATLAALGIDAFLDVAIVSEECGLRKPDPAIFLLACAKLDLAPAGVWFVGDDPQADVEGAARAGLRAVHFDPLGLSERSEGAIRRLPEILDSIRR